MVEMTAPTRTDLICDPACANQIEFVNLAIDELTAAGVIEARRFDESPFTDETPHGPDGLFEPAQVERLLATVREVRSRAEAA